MEIIAGQGIPEITLRLNAMSEWTSGQPSSSGVSKTKELIAKFQQYGIAVNIDLHTWYTTWDSYFRDSASNVAANRATYINYVEACIDAFEGEPVSAWMVLNEPQARTATTSENQFILDIIAAAKSLTSAPVSVRFMGGYSPDTGHYSQQIDSACDFLCRNVYWDPRNPGTTVYGVTQAKMNNMISNAQSRGKPLWITEFGESKDNLAEQAAYVAAFVAYANSEGISAIFCWVSQPESGSAETYNIFDGYTPNPAFYELIN